MTEGTIDSLQIEIESSSEKAINDVKKLTDSLKQLKAAQGAVKSGSSSSNNMMKTLSADSVLASSKIDLLRKKLDLLKKDLSSKIGLGKIDDKGIVNAALGIKSIQSQIEREQAKIDKSVAEEMKQAQGEAGSRSGAVDLAASTTAQRASAQASSSGLVGNIRQLVKMFVSSLLPGAKGFVKALLNAGSAAKGLVHSIGQVSKRIRKIASQKIKNLWDKSMFKDMESSLKRINTIVRSFGRIAFYRAIRSAIKYVTDALKEGTENAYWYSREFGDATHYISEAYDELASKNFKMSNQLGAAWSTMIAAIEPIILRIIELVTRAADAVTQLFATLSGKTIYMHAVDYNKQWAESADTAAASAKEWKNQLMGFDEINRLEEPSDPSGRGSKKQAPDYGAMFEEAPVSDWFQELKKMFENGEWAELGQLLGNKVNELVNRVNWREVGVKFGKNLAAAIKVGYNFLKTVDFRNIGTQISNFINGAMANIDFSEAGRLWMRMKTVLWDVIYGAVIGLDWGAFAKSLSGFVTGALTELCEWIKSLKPEEIAGALKDFFSNIEYGDIASAFKDVIKAAFELAIGVTEELFPDGLIPTLAKGVGNFIKKIFEALNDEDLQEAHNVMSYRLDRALFGEKWANFWWSHGEYAGKDIVMGLISGTQDSKSPLESTMQTDVEQPIHAAFDSAADAYNQFNNGYNTFTGNIDGLNSDLHRSYDGMKNGTIADMEQMEGKSSWLTKSHTSHTSQMKRDISDLKSRSNSDFNNIRTSMSNVGTSSENMANRASNAMSNMNGAVQSNGSGILGMLDSIASAAASAWSWLQAVSTAGESRIAANGGLWAYAYADGGFPEDGLFMANHGELVGQFSNGRTAVANNEQIVAGISQGVYQAVSSAMAQNGGNSGPSRISVNVNGREFYRATWDDRMAVDREHGVSLIANG